MEEVSNLYIISDFTYATLCKRLHKAAIWPVSMSVARRDKRIKSSVPSGGAVPGLPGAEAAPL